MFCSTPGHSRWGAEYQCRLRTVVLNNVDAARASQFQNTGRGADGFPATDRTRPGPGTPWARPDLFRARSTDQALDRLMRRLPVLSEKAGDPRPLHPATA